MLLGDNEDKKTPVKRNETVIYWDQDSSLCYSDNCILFRSEQLATQRYT